MESNNNEQRKAVIVRAWGDEPVKMFLHSIEDNVLYVGQMGSVHSIGLPLRDVYVFDDELFESLRSVYITHDMQALRALYENALDDFSCIKYQDKVISLHDQEGKIGNSSRTTNGVG